MYMLPMIRNQKTIGSAKAITKTVVLIPSMITWGIVFLVILLIGLGIMFIFFPTFTFFLKYLMLTVVGLITFGVCYSILTGFVREYIATAIVSLAMALIFVIVMRMFPFYWLIVITIIIGIVWIVLKTAGITKIFGE